MGNFMDLHSYLRTSVNLCAYLVDPGPTTGEILDGVARRQLQRCISSRSPVGGAIVVVWMTSTPVRIGTC